MRKKGYNVIPQMFDVRPVDSTGNLRMDKIGKLNKVVEIRAGKDNQPQPVLTGEREDTASDKCRKIESKASICRRGFDISVSQPIKNPLIKPAARSVAPSVQPAFAHKRQKSIIKKVPSLKSTYWGELSTAEKLVDYFSLPEKAGAKPSQKPVELFQKHHQASAVSTLNQDHASANETIPEFSQAAAASVASAAKAELPQTLQQIVPQTVQQTELAAPSLLKEQFQPEKKRKRKSKKPGLTFSKMFSANFYRAAFPGPCFQGPGQNSHWRHVMKPALGFALMLLFVCSSLIFGLVITRGWQLKDNVAVKGQQAIGYLASAKEDLENQDFATANSKFSDAVDEFEQAQKQLDMIGGDLLDMCSGLPYLSKASSAKNVIDAGQKLSQAAKNFTEVLQVFSEVDNPLSARHTNQRSLMEVFTVVHEQVSNSKDLLQGAQEDLENVDPQDLPEDYREKFEKIKGSLPIIIKMSDSFEKNYQIVLDLLGHNGPRKYLFIFQNNQEMRATGGFIGSYGIMDINNGHIRNMFIDGIYNPDGQLRENVVPPQPIQKISAAWSTHDANWFPNFPTTAEKIAWFYEKTGGPTVDGVISLTPTVLQKMLEITGPIEMSDYDTTVDKDNFIEKTQYEVEVDYDKTANKPKQFIADLAPAILDKVLSERDPSQVAKVSNVFSEAMKEKHIMMYSFNYNLQQVISAQGWSGEVLQTPKDYLMVINTNINGFKTDGVIDESISQRAEIQPDGTIIDTVRIKRTHKGGDSVYEWWDKVNSDYMRVYVPKGSRLLEVKGQTREFNQPPLDYDQLGFRRDPQVEQEEQSMQVDEASGTRIYEQENKTVFANWVYVSPKETVEIEYRYVLPFKIDLGKNQDRVDTYSLLAQKQSGSLGSHFTSEIIVPQGVSIVWKYPEASDIDNTTVRYTSPLKQDQFLGLVLQGSQN